MNSTHANHASGFTLVEVLVALAILSVSLAVLLQVFGTSLDRLRKSQAEMVAVSLTQSLLAEVGQTIPLRRGEANGSFGNGYHWRLHVEDYGDADDWRAWPTGAVVVSASTFWDEDRRSLTFEVLRLTPKDILR